MLNLHSALQMFKTLGYSSKELLACEEGLGIHVVSKATLAQAKRLVSTHMYLEYATPDGKYNVYAANGVGVTVHQHNNGALELSVYLLRSAFAA